MCDLCSVPMAAVPDGAMSKYSGDTLDGDPASHHMTTGNN